jgi:hypothetical protein
MEISGMIPCLNVKKNGVVRDLLNPAVSLTNKGDILTYSTTNATLPVGTAAQILIVDSVQVTGVKWGDVSEITNLSLNTMRNLVMFSNTYENTLTYRFNVIFMTVTGVQRLRSDMSLQTISTLTNCAAFVYTPNGPIRYIMVRENVFYRSDDGVTFTQYSVNPQYDFIRPLTINNNNYALSTNNFVYVDKWNAYYLTIYPTSYANSRLIKSNNGIDWVACSGIIINSDPYYVESIAYNSDGIMILVGHLPVSGYYSVDGITFAPFTSGSGIYGAVLNSGNLFVRVNYNYVSTSVLGVTWNSTVLSDPVSCVDYSPQLNMYIVISHYSKTYYISTDGGGTWGTAQTPNVTIQYGFGMIKWCEPYWIMTVHNDTPTRFTYSLTGLANSWSPFVSLANRIKTFTGFYGFAN